MMANKSQKKLMRKATRTRRGAAFLRLRRIIYCTIRTHESSKKRGEGLGAHSRSIRQGEQPQNAQTAQHSKEVQVAATLDLSDAEDKGYPERGDSNKI